MPFLWKDKAGNVRGCASDDEEDARVQDLATEELSKVAGCSVKKFDAMSDDQALKAIYRGCQRRADAIPNVSTNS